MAGRIVAVANLKGGVGKSTIAVNVAGAVSARGASVLLVDADAQGTASEWAADGALPYPVEAMPLEAGGDRRSWVGGVQSLAASVDLVLVDLPPHIGDTMAAALVAAALVIIPVTPSGADLRATTKAVELLRRAREARGGGAPAALMVPSKVDRRTAAGREIEAVLHDYGERVGPAITQRAAHVDAFTARQWIGSYASSSVAHQEVEALAAVVWRVVNGEAAKSKA